MAAARSLPAVLLLAATGVLAWSETGSIEARDWLLYAIFAALLLALALAVGTAVLPPRAVLVGMGALVLFAIWQAVSASWSALPSLARDDALLTLFYLAALALGSLAVGRTAGVVVTGAVAALGGGLAVATALGVRFGSEPAHYFVGDGRLAWPITYPNAAAAMFLVGLWPGLVLAAERRLPSVARALAVGAAAATLAGWLLTQSKGGGIALAVSAVGVFAASPSRLRLLMPALLVSALVGPQFHTLTAPFNAEAELGGAAKHGAVTLLWLTAVATGIGLVYALVDRRVTVGRRTRRAAGAAALALLVAALMAGVVGFFASVDHPGRFFEDKWSSFKHSPVDEEGSTHFLSLGSNRYDFWRVALSKSRDHPLGGIGDRGFGPAYLIEGRSGETPARAHSIELDALSELGVAGLVLLSVGLGALFWGCVGGMRRREPVALAAFGTGAYWLVHASGDWNWTVPAVGVPFFVLLGAGAASADARPLRRLEAWPAGIVAVAVALLLFVPPWLSSRFSRQALEGSSSPASDLRWARRLDPLSVEPYLVEAHIAPTPELAIPPLQRAAEKQPRSVEVRFELGMAYLRAQREALARSELQAALALEPFDPSIKRALRRVKRSG